MGKLIAILGGAVLLGAGIATVQLVGSSEPAAAGSGLTVTDTVTTGATTTVTTAADISGPCDEAEHANDPRCAGGSPAPPAAATTTTVDVGADVSGPCDEAEHANDARCTGGVDADRGDDRSGRRGGDDEQDEHDNDDDRSGSNSGRG